MVIIPNKLMVNSRIVNYYYPSTDTGFTVELSVHYASDLERVEQVTLEAARETLKECSGAVAVPTIRFKSLGDSGVYFEVGMRANDFESISLVKHDFIKRVLARYAKDGIVVPYPVRAINYDQEKAFASGRRLE
jgi:small-conductance mechanosensitive channel